MSIFVICTQPASNGPMRRSEKKKKNPHNMNECKIFLAQSALCPVLVNFQKSDITFLNFVRAHCRKYNG